MSEQYFSVQHCLSISVIPMEPDFTRPDQEAFEAEIPESFKISNTMVQIDYSNARVLRSVMTSIFSLMSSINRQKKSIY